MLFWGVLRHVEPSLRGWVVRSLLTGPPPANFDVARQSGCTGMETRCWFDPGTNFVPAGMVNRGSASLDAGVYFAPAETAAGAPTRLTALLALELGAGRRARRGAAHGSRNEGGSKSRGNRVKRTRRHIYQKCPTASAAASAVLSPIRRFKATSGHHARLLVERGSRTRPFQLPLNGFGSCGKSSITRR